MKVPIALVVIASIFGFVALVILFLTLCNIGEGSLEQILTMSVVRIILLFLVAIAGWFLFNNGLDVVQKELVNIEALLNLAVCSD
jgi:hypothetical protein